MIPDCQPEESPFPGIEDRVRILAPGILSSLILEAHVNIFDDASPISEDVTIDRNGVGKLLLPDDFLRLTTIKMTDWKRPVNHITSPEDPDYIRQTSNWAGIKGNPDRPVAIMDITPERKLCLLLFSSSQSARLSYGFYIPAPTVTADDKISIPRNLYLSLLEKLKDAL